MAVDPVPAGFHTVTPYLTVKGATEFAEEKEDMRCLMHRRSTTDLL